MIQEKVMGIVSLPVAEQDALQSVLQAYYAWNREYAALNADQKAEFCRLITLDSGNAVSPDSDITTGAGILKDDPYWEEFNRILKGFRRPSDEA